MSIVLIVAAVAGFIVITEPLYKDISGLKAEASVYQSALNNAKEIANKRDALTAQRNAMNQSDIDRLQKMVPDSVDNIRLILEIEQLAAPYGMVLRDIQYDTLSQNALASGQQASASTDQNQVSTDTSAPDESAGKDYGVWTLQFSTQAPYQNFLSFVSDLEKNLRIVDIASIDFSSDSGAGLNPGLSESYKYNFKIKTYWLKN
ncbi:MAG TPA: hypothetical protein VG694_02050 [Candidatus Paceibacterota bacterium]|jgi:Tfp pilus assembly protein PilO|nr:hypothetical protein [Candidatus Paceibacterota bacterium]